MWKDRWPKSKSSVDMSKWRRNFTENMVVDTTVWVHFFRKKKKAREFLLGLRRRLW
jgi:hypothetical protein